MNEKIERLLKWANNETPPPFTLDISPTDRCNLSCLSCWQRGFKNIDSAYELPDGKLKEVIKDAIELGVKEFEITGGGEPLMRRKLVLEIMEMIKSNDCTGNITTNGMLFLDSDIKKMVNIGWDRVTFSLDGPDADTNDLLRGRKSFEKLVRNLDKFNEYKKLYNSKKPAIKFNTVLSNKNYNKVKKMIEFAHERGCEIVSFEPVTVHSPLGEKLRLNTEEIKELNSLIPETKALADKYRIYTNIAGLSNTDFIEKSNNMLEVIKSNDEKQMPSKPELSSALCFEPWWHLVIKVDGSAQPCCLYDMKEENVKTKKLKEIWYGKFFEKTRRDVLNKSFSKFCSICNSGQVMENRRIGEMLRNDKK